MQPSSFVPAASAASPCPPVYTEERVREMVAAFYSPSPISGATPVQANEFLVEFQQHASAWPVCISFLNQFSLSSPQAASLSAGDECLLYFASQTLAAQARAGFPQQLSLLLAGKQPAGGAAEAGGGRKRHTQIVSSIFKELREGLLQLLFACRHAPKAVVRQLAVALSAALVFGACGGGSDDRGEGDAAGEDTDELQEEIALEEILVTLGQKLGEQAAGPLLELLISLPQEVSSQRLSLSQSQRLAVLGTLLQRHSGSALAAAASVFDFLERRDPALGSASQLSSGDQILTLKSAAVTAVRAWISAHMSLLSASACQASEPAGVSQIASSCTHLLFHSLLPAFLPSSLLAGAASLPSESALRVVLSTLQSSTALGILPEGATSQNGAAAQPRAPPETIDGLQAAADAVAALAALASAVANAEAAEDEETGGLGAGRAAGGLSAGKGAKQREEERSTIRAVMEIAVHGYGVACEALQREMTQGAAVVDADRLQAFSVGLLELAKEVLPAFLHGDPWPLSPSSTPAAPSAATPHSAPASLAHICAFAADTLLTHPSLDVKELGLDFHYNFLFHFMTLAAQQQELFQNVRAHERAFLAEPADRRTREAAAVEGLAERPSPGAAAPAAGSSVDGASENPPPPALAAAHRMYASVAAETEARRRRLFPIYLRFLDVLVAQVSAPPADCVVDERVDLERWCRFRDEAAGNLTEATLVVGHARLLEKTRDELEKVVALGLLAGHSAAEAQGCGGAAANTPGASSASSSSPLPWQRLEACLFVVTTVAPRAPAGEDRVIPFCLEVLPRLPYATALDLGNPERGAGSSRANARRQEDEREATALFLYAAAGRFILWTAGYIGTQKFLFAQLLHFLASSSLPFVIKAAQRQKAMLDSGAAVCKLRELAEEVLVEAMKALAASAAPILAEEVAEEDINIILNSIVSLILEENLSIDSRAALVLAAGAVLAPMPADKMRALHRQLLSSLGQNLREVLARPDSSSTAYRNAVKLFFSAIQGLRPSYALPLPPSTTGDLCEPLPKDSPYRHPVLDVTEELWETVEAAMKNPRRHEHLYEQSTYAIVAVISTCRAHVPRYLVLFRFLDVLAETFALHPTAYHLGALRTLEGLFGSAPEEPVLDAVCDCLRRCVLATLERINVEGEHYVYRQPDLVGMTVDSVNIALLHPLQAMRFIQPTSLNQASASRSQSQQESSNWFCTLALAVLQFAPTCHHPKVLHTFMVFFSRLAGWTDPPSQLHAFDRGGSIPWLLEAAEKTQQAVLALLLRPPPVAFSSSDDPPQPEKQSYATVTIRVIVHALTSVHAAVQSWIGNAAQALLLLLHHPVLAEQSRVALESAVMSLHPHLLTPEQRRGFLRNALAEASVRGFCNLCQQLADDAKAQFHRNKFSAGFPTSAGLQGGTALGSQRQ
ncbi:hypothetical protein BESB_066230 [Besnoitia besnoiti]|uniref:Exportin-1/Importin-beta-like domain-containing protein n=1 Tax=Besnoitia besnoiti TaxID=94643 RepID=A0A2A9MGP2_BESBE|nr:hypothetical protein BESB_066230 [Besnoitia besnoiti]PFH34590.1 hypothetical protein BESB_066230 [Besnoitia besnoiti]